MLQHRFTFRETVGKNVGEPPAYCQFLAAAAVVLAMAPGFLAAQQTGGDNSYVVTMHRVEVIGYGGRVDLVLIDTKDPDEADTAERNWHHDHPDDLRLTRTVKHNVRITPPPPAPPPPPPNLGPKVNRPTGGISLANTTWAGNETLGGKYGALSFDFRADHTVTMHDPDGATKGEWRLVGNQLTLLFRGVAYVGTVNGSVIEGHASNGKNRWNWRVQVN
jgi:hypothetical protein